VRCHSSNVPAATVKFAPMVVSIIVVFASCQTGVACTAFMLQDGQDLVAAKNYDYNFSDGFVMVNKRNVSKQAMLLGPDTAAQWTSKYGSVTFNQYGREMPIGGMNEAGLVVETLMLPASRYPEVDDRPAVMSWMQYQLDCHGTVAEVLASDKQVRMHYAIPMPLHFFVCDRQGQAATIEFIDGRLVCHSAATLPVEAITNSTYTESTAFLRQYEGFGGNQAIPRGVPGSLERFACAAARVKNYKAGPSVSPIAYAFETLNQVRQGNATQWSIVYDLANLEIHYRTQKRRRTKIVKLAGLDFGCQEPVQMIGINTPRTGLLNSHLFDYDPELNRHLVFYAIRHTLQTKFLPEAVINQLADYPETTSCK